MRYLRPLKHRCGWEGAASESNVARYSCLHVGAASKLFFFFSRICFDSARFAPTQLLFSPIRTKPERFGQNQAESGHISRRPKRSKQAEISLESCRNSRNRLWMRPKHPKSVLPQFYYEYLLLLLCFLFCFVFLAFFFLWFSNVLFKNILIVKIYRKYK